MSAYTTQRWPGPRHFPGPSDLRLQQDNEGRDLRLDHSEPVVRENGIGEKHQISYRDNNEGKGSPLPLAHGPINDMPSYNRSVCDSEMNGGDYGRHSSAANLRCYPTPTGSPGRGQPYPMERPFGGDVRPLKFHHYQNGSYRQPLHVGLQAPIRYGPPLEPPHSFRGRPRGPPPPRVRHPLLISQDERFNHRPHFLTQGTRSPVIGPPTNRTLDQQPPGAVHCYNGGFRSLEDRHPPNDIHDLPPNDPRLHHKSVESGNHSTVHPHRRLIPLTGSPLQRISKLNSSPDVELITRDHSYCDKRLSTSSVSLQNHTKLEPLKETALPRSLLTPVPRATRKVSISQTTSIFQSSLKQTIPKPVTQSALKRNIHWPVPHSYSLNSFSLDLDSEQSSSSEDEDDRWITKNGFTHVSKVGVSGNEDVVTKPVGSCDSSHDPPGEANSVKTTTRRSKRLANVDVSSPRAESPADQNPVSPDHPTDQLKVKTRKMLRNTHSKRGRKKIGQRQNKPADKKNKPTTRSSHGDGVPAEIKRLVSGHFTPEILVIRSRAESHTLARRSVMEKVMEQNTRERIQTAVQGVDSEDVGGVNLTSKLTSPMDAIDDASSEHSVTMTTSSSQTLSYEQSSSHDLDSGSHDLESMSIHSSDIISDQFTPDLVARCKRISTAKSSGDTPLHKVCRSGKFDMARYYLLVEKVNPNNPDNAGWTPLHEACSSNRSKVARLLLQNGADANVSARDGTRPIHDAIEIGSLEIVRILIEHGADPTAELGDKTPLEFAKSMGQMEIYNFLQPAAEERIKAQKVSTSIAQPVVARRSTRRAKQTEPIDEVMLTLPVDGYTSDDPYFGAELDHPLFYICPVLELSEAPLLPVYNFEIVEGTNPRRHNFYFLNDLLSALRMSESELRAHCSEITALEMKVREVLENLKHPYYNRHVRIPASWRCLSPMEKIRFLPVCSQLRNLLDIEMVNLDN